MREFRCECGETLESWRGEDVDCDRCGALYNAFGQRLRERYVYDEDLGCLVDTWREDW